jgi:hypothetical protein
MRTSSCGETLINRTGSVDSTRSPRIKGATRLLGNYNEEGSSLDALRTLIVADLVCDGAQVPGLVIKRSRCSSIPPKSLPSRRCGTQENPKFSKLDFKRHHCHPASIKNPTLGAMGQ